MKHEQSEDGKQVKIVLDKSDKTNSKDIVVSFSTENIREPVVKVYKSDKHPEELAAHISFIPRVSDEHEANEETKQEPDDKSTEATEPSDDADDPEMASGEFIFVLDRSGSMRRNRIDIAKEALKLFIQSLPSDCLFNIFSFGTSMKQMYKESQSYTKDIINKTLAEIDTMQADMGGTNMLAPVSSALKAKLDTKYPKNIFILTDGSIGNTDEVVSEIRKFNYLARVHTFGIGSGASRYLVKETAKAGLGTSALIADNDPQIKAKIIQALKVASKPAFTDIKVSWGSNEDSLVFQCPKAPVSRNIYEEEAFDVYAILKKSDVSKSDLSVHMFNTFDQEEQTITLEFDPEKLIEGGDSIFKMAAKEQMVQLRRSEEDSKTRDAGLLDLSLKYSVLSEKTAFFGKVKNTEKSGEEMKTIEIPIKRGYENQNMSRNKNKRQHAEAMRCAKMPTLRSNRARPMSAMEPQLCSAQGAQIRKPQAGFNAAVELNQKRKRLTELKKESSKKKCIKSNKMESDIDDLCMDILSGSSSSKPSYNEIVQFQEPQGYFTDLPTKYQRLIDTRPLATLEE